jgi:RNA polymerase sigma-70 factor (ECF subfamily)
VPVIRAIQPAKETMNEGDRENLITELVCAKLPALVLFARQWKHDSAEDVVQEAFLRLMRLADPPQDPVAWLFAAVRNASNQHLRTQKRRKNRESLSQEDKRPWFTTANGDGELIAELQSLPLTYRTVIVAKIWGNLTFEQIAGLIGLSKSSAHRVYDEGLALLRKKWEGS